jgi:glucose/arabinose dehydrogenase
VSRRASSRTSSRALRFAAALALLAVVSTAGAATLPPGFSETQFATGLAAPTAMAFAPDGRLFVAEQGGALRVIKGGTLLSQPFVTVTVDSAGERGLLGVAFDPNFATNGFVYIYYTATTPTIHNRVSRFRASGDVALPGSEVPILDLNNLSTATNHNGGAIHFGPDGKLYIAVGDNANGTNSQSLTTLLGKILRINSDGSIPSDNPFFDSTIGNNGAIWALGLRNPFTFTFQSGTGRMFINDVGENTWEEIDDGIAGSNYGWPTTEGPTSDPRFRSPIFSYMHGSSSTTGCAITGGAFYNPPTSQFPSDYVGDYFFADFCSGWIRKLDPANGNSVADFASGAAFPVDLLVGNDGLLYYLTRGGAAGSVYRASFSAPAPAFSAKVNFQPASAPAFTGYSVDSGAVYGARGNGLVYGWNATTSTFDRNSRRSPDQRYDTLAAMQQGANPNASWEIAVPNGTYTVHVVAGDPASHKAAYRITVEGVLTVNGDPTGAARWFEGTRTVNVSDGRLTVANGAGASNDTLCFLEVASAG